MRLGPRPSESLLEYVCHMGAKQAKTSAKAPANTLEWLGTRARYSLCSWY